MATILVVDDRPANRQFLLTLLGYDGHRLLEAEDGATGLALLRAERPDLVITDILMPVMDGYEFAQLVRADPDPAVAGTPIIFYTATYNAREGQALARSAGVHYVISKPATPQVILGVVNTALGLAPAEPAKAESGPLEDPLRAVTSKLTEKMGELSGLEQRLAALVDLMLKLATEREPGRLLSQACDGAREIVGAQYAAIDMLANSHGARHLVTSGLDAETAARIGPLPTGQGLLGKLLLEGKPLRLADLNADPRAAGLPPGHPPMRSFLGVPIASPEGHYGRLYLTEKIGALEFSADDEQLAVALAAQAAVAYENALRYDEIQSYTARLRLEVAERQKTRAALEASEKRFRALIENDASGIAVAAADGRLLYTSPSAARILGREAGEATGRSPFDFVHPDDLEAARGMLGEILMNPSQHITRMLRARHADGSWHWLEFTLSNLLDEPAVGGIVSNYRDVSKRMAAEAALRAAEERFTKAFQASPAGISISKLASGEFLDINASFERQSGYSREELIGHTAAELTLITAETREQFSQQLRRQGTVRNLEMDFRSKSGELRQVLASMEVIDVGGEACILSILQEITDRIRAEARLAASERRFRALIDNAPDGISVLGPDGKTSYASPAVERLLGYTPAEMVGGDPAGYIHPDDAGRLLALLDDLTKKPGQSAQAQYRFRHKDGTWRWLESTLSNLLADPSVGGIVFNYRDVSERRQAEETIQQLAAIVESSNEAIIGCSLEGRITSWNSAAQAILGYGAAAMRGRPLATLAAPEQMQALAGGLERLQAGERIEPVEQVWTHQDGHAVNVAASLSLVRAAEGQIIGSSIIARDISSSKRAEAALQRRSEEELRQRQRRVILELVLIAVIGVVILGLSIYFDLYDRLFAWAFATPGNFADEGFLALLAVMAGLLVFAFRRWQESIHEVSRGKQAEQTLQTLHEELETRIRARTVDLVRSNAALQAEVNERQEAEKALAASEAELRGLFAAMNDVVVVLDDQGRYLQVAPTNPALLLRPAAELLGHTLHELLPRVDADRMLEQIRLALQQSNALQFEYSLAINGVAMWFETNISPIGADRVIWVSRDVTQQRQRQLEMGAIAAVSTALRSAPGRAQMSPIIVDQLLELFSAYGAALDLYDAADGTVTIDSARGAWQALTGRQMDATEGIIGHVITSGERYVNNDAQSESRLFAGVAGETVRAVACVPIIAQGRVLGGLWVGRQLPFGDDDLRVLMAIADMAGNAMQRASLHEQTERRLEHLAALRAIDTAISSGLDVAITLNLVLDQAVSQLRVDAADILLLNPNSHQLQEAAGRGFRSPGSRRPSQRLGQGYAAQAALERRAISLPSLEQAKPDASQASLWSSEGFKAYYNTPLLAKGAVVGVLEIYQRGPLQPDAEWRGFLEALAGQAAIAVDSARLFHELQRSNVDLTLAYEATIEGWSRALDLRDKETEGHTQRVTDLTLKLADRFGIRDKQLNQIHRGALLHDIGKMGVPDSILLKPGPLTDAEWRIMRQHPQLAYQMLAPIAYLTEALDIPYCHHEKWDGSGYPRGLRGEQIPLAARIFAVVDVWDALCSDRPYRHGWPKAEVRAHIRAGAGTHFDPAVVTAFEQLLDEEI